MSEASDNQHPRTIDGADVICFARLENLECAETTNHMVKGEYVNQFIGLAIASFSGEMDFYLFYCGEDWSVLTDTLHQSIDSAKQQAEFEFPGVSTRWRDSTA